MHAPRLTWPLRWQAAAPTPQAASRAGRLRPRIGPRAPRRDARHPVRGALLMQRHGAAAERWGWPGMAALGCAALSLMLWALHPTSEVLTSPVPDAGVPAREPAAAAGSAAVVPPEAAQRLQDLEALATWFGQHALQWRAATYRWTAVPGEPAVWTIDAVLQGSAVDLEGALARLPQDFAHLRVDDLRLSQGPGQQLQARLRLQLRYRSAASP